MYSGKSAEVKPLPHLDSSAADYFENIVVKGETAHNKQFSLLQQCFQLYSNTMLLFVDIFPILAWIISQTSAACLLKEGKG